MTKRKILLALCVVGVSLYAINRAESKDSNPQETAAGIPFEDQAHSSFFNYQSYLVQHGKGGDTLETWQALPNPERVKKVADGEALLTKLRAELSAKDKLDSEETELFQTVWGRSDAAGDKGFAHQTAAVSGEKTVAAEKVNALSETVGGFQKNEHWGRLFDGSRDSTKGVEAVSAAGGYRKRAVTSSEVSPKTPIIRPIDEAKVPPAGSGDGNEPLKRTLPLATGVALVTGAYYALKKKAQIESPVEVQVSAVRELVATPERRAEFLKNPGAYAAKNNVSFDPAVVEMTQSALVRYEQEIARLGSGNPYHQVSDDPDGRRGMTTLAASAAVAAGAAVISAVAAATQATSAAKAAK